MYACFLCEFQMSYGLNMFVFGVIMMLYARFMCNYDNLHICHKWLSNVTKCHSRMIWISHNIKQAVCIPFSHMNNSSQSTIFHIQANKHSIRCSWVFRILLKHCQSTEYSEIKQTFRYQNVTPIVTKNNEGNLKRNNDVWKGSFRWYTVFCKAKNDL